MLSEPRKWRDVRLERREGFAPAEEGERVVGDRPELEAFDGGLKMLF